MKRVGELNGIVNVENVTVQTGRIGDGGVVAMGVEQKLVEISERDGVTLDELVVDLLGAAWLILSVERESLDESTPDGRAEAYANEMRPEVVVGEQTVQV